MGNGFHASPQTPAPSPQPSRHALSRGWRGVAEQRHHLGGEALHLLVLRAELQKQEIDPSRLYRGAGFGVQLVTPFGPIGLDYAYGFDKARPGWQLHFKMGPGM